MADDVIKNVPYKPLRNLIKKVVKKIRKIVEYPVVDIIKMNNTSTSKSINPFDNPRTETIIIKDVPCVVSSQPEIVVNGSNLTTKESMYIFIHENDYDGDISMEDRFIFEGKRYRPVEIQDKRRLYGLWRIKVEKES